MNDRTVLQRDTIERLARQDKGTYFVRRYSMSAGKVRKLMREWVKESDCPFNENPKKVTRFLVYELKSWEPR